MCHRVNVEEVFKNSKGEFNGMQSGKTYEKKEIEQIGGLWWTKPAPPASQVVLEIEDDPDSDKEKGGSD